jgi:hypothetical protein
MAGDANVNIVIVSPTGDSIGVDESWALTNTIGVSATYSNEFGEDSIVIDSVRTGEYVIKIEAETDAPVGATYQVGLRTDGTVEQTTIEPTLVPNLGEVVEVVHETIPNVRGDADGSGSLTIGDVTFLIARIFSGGAAPVPAEAGDADCNGSLTIADVTFLIAFIFSGGGAPGC